MSSSLVGRTLGNYKVIDVIGRGGMAAVYLGYQEAVDRRVAIKVLPPHPGLDEQFIERFKLEARTIARLQHPHILPLYDYGSTEDGILYLAMAYISGGSLDNLIAQGPVKLSTVERIVREIAGALDYAHRQGVIHRDIKPGNILMDGEGHALLADFGIVKLSENEGGGLTGTSVVGTPAYMSPEQAQGLELDGRSDIYSLGVVVYHLLTGQQPFTAPSVMQLILKVMQEPPPSILEATVDLPGDLADVMDRVLAKNRDQRYQTATEFADAFSDAIHDTDASRFVARTQRPTPMSEAETYAAPIPTIRSPVSSNDSQTIIVQQGVNPTVIIGVVAVIAVAMIAAVMFIVGGADLSLTGGGATDGDTPTAVVSQGSPVPPTFTPRPTIPVVPTFGQLSFSTVNGLGDSVSLRVQNLRPPASGRVYVAWLVNTSSGEQVQLGNLSVDALGNGALSFTHPDGLVLPALYNAVAISLEETGFDADAPQGAISYSGQNDITVPEALTEILVMSPDGIRGGSLLAGAKVEADFSAQHAGLASNASTLGGMRSHSEHTINILRGERVDYEGNGSGINPGRGIGVYFFMDKMEVLLDRILNAPGVGLTLQTNAEFMRICLQNTRLRADRIVELELEMLAGETLEAVADQAAESTLLATQIRAGVDANEDGLIDPVEGECGLDQVDIYSILIGSLDIIEGSL